MTREELTEHLADWIDSTAIATDIVAVLEEQGITPDYDKGREVWLDFLETELSDGLEKSVKYLANREKWDEDGDT